MPWDFAGLDKKFKEAEDRVKSGQKLLDDEKMPTDGGKLTAQFHLVMRPYTTAKDQYDGMLKDAGAKADAANYKKAVARYKKLLAAIGEFRKDFKTFETNLKKAKK